VKLSVRVVLLCLWLPVIGFSLWLTLLFYTKSYDGFIEWLVAALQKSDNWISFFKNRFSVNIFQWVKQLIIVFDAGVLFLSGWGVYNHKKIEAAVLPCVLFFIGRIKKGVRRFNALPLFERSVFWIITLFAFGKALWYDAVFPVQYDEAWSYNYYISNDLWQSFLLPSNNHKLFTFIAWWFNLLPFDKLFMIRIPNAFAGVFLFITFFYFAKKYFSSGVALLGFVWLATCVPVAGYMTSARSYIYVVFFSLLLLILYFESDRFSRSRSFLLLFILTIVLGYSSNPTFFLCHFILSVYFFLRRFMLRRFNVMKRLFTGNLVALPFLGLLYTSDILGGHFSGLLDIAYKENNHQNYFWECIRFNAGFQTGFENAYILFVIILLAGIGLLFTKFPKPGALLFYAVLSIAWLPVYSLLVHEETSRHKTIYITISVTLLLMFILQFLFDSYLKNKYLIVLAALFITGINTFNLNRHSWFTWSVPIDKSVRNVSHVLLENHAVDCYVIPFYYKPGIEFYHKINSERIRLYMDEANSVDYDETLLIKKYPEFILTDQVQKDTIMKDKYRIVFSDEFVALYKIDGSR
jgi:hypothetical protein